MTTTRLAIAAALAILLGASALTTEAGAYNCTSYRSGSYTYTNCY